MAKPYLVWAAIALSVTLAACNPQTAQTDGENSTSSPSPETVTDPSATVSPAPLQAKVELGTIQSLQSGDRACYVEVLGASGSISKQLAGFEICENTDLVGQPARLFYEPQSIQAASCQGNPECRDRETVLLIVRAESTATPAPAAQASATQPPATQTPVPVAQTPTATPIPTPVPTPIPQARAPRGDYMGIAATGEDVYYNGIAFQCGDLPPNDRCWSRPNVSYTIGNDEVFGIVDCQQMVLTEAWVGGELVAENLSPQSEAIASVLSLACYEAFD
ncbi:hypothetical protein [Sodalinema gerasimenkoae]|uniref:hypothetical protein n=1 Tax=Sodalinema gerasimenkoae TaxID=2862348 RepID=UPI0013586943|nr:hypothetical protein [Sodalinema gerasimenkoae]